MVSVNERERDVRAAVQRVESSNESSPPALDDVDPQQQELENHHQLRQRTPTTSKCLFRLFLFCFFYLIEQVEFSQLLS